MSNPEAHLWLDWVRAQGRKCLGAVEGLLRFLVQLDMVIGVNRRNKCKLQLHFWG
jgi:hypothetical protein